MSRDKQIEEMAKILCTDYDMGKCMVDGFDCLEGHCSKRERIEALYNAGYRKSSEVALEAIEDFQRTIRHIFLDMCNGNDYNTLNLLQIDSAIEALFDNKIAELKKKYESEKDNG